MENESHSYFDHSKDDLAFSTKLAFGVITTFLKPVIRTVIMPGLDSRLGGNWFYQIGTSMISRESDIK